jgi:hypothetical protein
MQIIKQLFILFTYSVLTATLYAQPDIQWRRTFGGSSYDVTTVAHQTADGGYIITGYTESNDDQVSGNHGAKDIWIIKLNAAGSITWRKTFGGSNDDLVSEIKQTAEGDYMIWGSTSSTDGDLDFNDEGHNLWIFKISATGDLLWGKTFGSSDSTEHLTEIQSTTDGGYLLTGLTVNIQTNYYASLLLIKITENGDLVWKKIIEDNQIFGSCTYHETTDGGYIIAAQRALISPGNDYQVVVYKLNSTAEEEWKKTFDGSENDIVFDIRQTPDDGYILCGRTKSNDGDFSGPSGSSGGYDAFVIKLNTAGTVEWQKCIGDASPYEVATKIELTNDGGYIFAGETFTLGTTKNNGWVVKLTETGAVSWQKTMGGSLVDLFTSIEQTTDGGYLVAGTASSNNGDVPVAHGLYDFWLVKLKPETVGTGAIAIPASVPNITVSPNPAHGHRLQTTFDLPESGPVSITLFDPLGHETAVLVSQQWYPAGTNHADFALPANLLPQQYVLVLKTEKGIFSNKVAIVD